MKQYFASYFAPKRRPAGNTQTTTPSTAARPQQIPVSSAYYTKLVTRVKDIFAALHKPDTYVDQTMRLIHRYFATGKIATNADPTCRIVFLSLHDDISSAISRSRNARTRAINRPRTPRPHTTTPRVAGHTHTISPCNVLPNASRPAGSQPAALHSNTSHRQKITPDTSQIKHLPAYGR